jgi:hypothetical protein
MLSLFLASEATDEPSYGENHSEPGRLRLYIFWKSFNLVTSLLAKSMHSSLHNNRDGIDPYIRNQFKNLPSYVVLGTPIYVAIND